MSAIKLDIRQLPHGEGLPLLVDLVGFTGSGLSHTNWVGFRENLPERIDRLFTRCREMPVNHYEKANLHRLIEQRCD